MPQVTRILGAAALCGAAALTAPAAVPPASALTAASATGAARAVMPPPARDGDHLTVVVEGAGRDVDGTYELRCRPVGGSHPDPAGACTTVEGSTRAGQDAFAPVPQGSVCTMQYGGPATARVTGTWARRPVDTTYDRSNGCQIVRWDRLVPLLPDLRQAPGVS
ncbi:SSI family serine proteinase inhibitor [Streptomyces poriticola]|uniref:SSI family serine proteinase inhibitor n=1 Tax=Streptomyces poriticola TaxID=3120506 RepID=UPI002FCE5890